MSQSPAPIDYAGMPAERPTSVTALAIIGIVIACLGILCKPLALAGFFITLPQPDPGMEAIKNDTFAYLWMFAATGMSWFLSMILLVGSIGALGLKQWARQALVGWSIAMLLLALASLAVSLFHVNPLLAEAVKTPPKGPAAWFTGTRGTILGTVIVVLLPIPMLHFMNRPHVKDAFARGLKRVI